MKVDIGPYPNGKRKRKVKIKIHGYDIWDMNATLTSIILPMMKMLQKQKAGAPHVDDYDVPIKLRSTSAPPRENEWSCDKHWFKRWSWVVDEIVWTFEQLSGEDDVRQAYVCDPQKITQVWVPCDDSDDRPEYEKFYKVKKVRQGRFGHFEDCKEHCDNHEAKVCNGLRLFGKYYQALWT